MRQRQWMRVRGGASAKLPSREKESIGLACEKLIAECLKPRYLPETRSSTQFNYVVDIRGRWHGSKYRFLKRYRSDHPDAIEPEFDAPFARLEYVARDCFNVSFYRHTETWFCLYRSLSLSDALSKIRDDPILHPH